MNGHVHAVGRTLDFDMGNRGIFQFFSSENREFLRLPSTGFRNFYPHTIWIPNPG